MTPQDVLERQDYEFAAAIQQRPVHATYVILAFNLLTFALMYLAANGADTMSYLLMGPSSDVLAGFGAKVNLKIDQGEYWRFLTPVFLHIGGLHLLANSYALWNVGPQVEKLYGSARFLVLYIGAGIAGVVCSYQFNPIGLSAGASGAIFGLFGVLLMFGLRHKNTIPAFYRSAMIRGVLPVIVINLLIGQTIPFIDNSAHIGGLLGGALLAALIYYERPGTAPGSAFNAIPAVAAFMVLASFFQVYRHYNDPIDSSVYGDNRASIFIAAINSAENSFRNSIDALNSRDMSKVSMAKPRTRAAVDELKAAPALAPEADKFRDGMLTIIEEQSSIEADIESTGTVTFIHQRRAKANAERYEELNRSFRNWVRTDGIEYGIKLRQ